MECNKDEALRAKEIAEKKLMAGDIKGSQRFAEKAQKLYPCLSGLSHMMTAIEVHLAAQKKLNSSGLMDWYAILQVSSSSESDASLIKKQYKKLALVLHPDKNKSPGAEGAFKLITEAWGVLSDQSKKTYYDLLRKSLFLQQQHKCPPCPPNPNATTSFSFPNKRKNKTHVNSNKEKSVVGSAKKRNVNARSQVDAHINSSSSKSPSPAMANRKANNSIEINTPIGNSLNEKGECIPTPVANKAFCPTSAPSTTSPFSTSTLNGHNGTPTSSCKKMQDCPSSQERQNIKDCSGPVEVATMSINDHPKSSNNVERGDTTEENGINEKDKFRKHAANKAQRETKKVNISNKVESGDTKEENGMNEKDKFRKHAANKAQRGTKKMNKEPRKRKKPDSVPFKEDPSVKIVNPASIDVMDPDFYNFDQDRMENCFEENQIWALYDDDGGMPRYYALINKIVSLHPFMVQMSWLDRKDNNGENLIKWANAGFFRACGEFEVGRKTSTEFLNVFSHVMNGEQVVAGLVKIFPRKGSVWALYREWQSDWDVNTPPEVRHKYEVVEVITDFKETCGGSVVPLVKLNGFKTVYQKKQTGAHAVRWILKTEFLRFSHQIPARRLLGNDARQLPEGCLELDPAATPMD